MKSAAFDGSAGSGARCNAVASGPAMKMKPRALRATIVNRRAFMVLSSTSSIEQLRVIHKKHKSQRLVEPKSIMDLNTIRLFVAVAEAGSLTGAGRDLGLTTSGV